MTRFSFFLFLVLIGTPALAGDDHGHDTHDEDTEQTTIDPAHAKDMGIEIDTAGQGRIRQTLALTGKITLNTNRVAQIRARFPGIVRDVKVMIGDPVKKGQTLAIVESNESLQAYAVTSPLDGVILERNTSTGDMTESDTLFVVADLTRLWAEFFVFPRDAQQVKEGQIIRVKSLTDESSTPMPLTRVLPMADSTSQTLVARAELENNQGVWRPGMNIRGEVILSEQDVPVAVKTAAIQRQNDGHVVYLRQGDTYTQRAVILGQRDKEWTEIRKGLKAGDTYVSQNSFVIKADIAKSEAEHAH